MVSSTTSRMTCDWLTWDEELVEAHGGVDGNFAAEVVFDLVLFDGFGRHVGHQLGQAENSHGLWTGLLSRHNLFRILQDLPEQPDQHVDLALRKTFPGK